MFLTISCWKAKKTSDKDKKFHFVKYFQFGTSTSLKVSQAAIITLTSDNLTISLVISLVLPQECLAKITGKTDKSQDQKGLKYLQESRA